MKALSLSQPFATLVAIGAKRIETRSWRTTWRAYNGPIAIHAAKDFPSGHRHLCSQQPFCTALAAAGIHRAGDLPRGAIVATCRVADCISTDYLARGPASLRRLCASTVLGQYEDAFGDYTPGRYAWVLTDIVRLREPIPAKGALGLWNWQPPLSMRLPHLWQEVPA